ncbi:fluoride efflux transporter FluC [Faecalispora anaeroviscerum]|uniref:fluoride efflux transporter FluC n=1 Tax=Faecalispora anaeroviscerum TaxID=2991836 RepID=UPI0024BA7FB6|nr:CrcB family protein [Faecalispora anaeroviscerum]
MKKYIFLSCGSMIGAIARYLVERIKIPGYHEALPLNTLFINITGAFLIAFILTIGLEIWSFDPDLRLGLTTGLMGAYTTFSTMCKEASVLLFQGEYISAISYLIVSAALGLGAVYLGITAARALGTKWQNKGSRSESTCNYNENEVD